MIQSIGSFKNKNKIGKPNIDQLDIKAHKRPLQPRFRKLRLLCVTIIVGSLALLYPIMNWILDNYEGLD